MMISGPMPAASPMVIAMVGRFMPSFLWLEDAKPFADAHQAAFITERAGFGDDRNG